MDPIETEVKFFLKEPKMIRQKILDLGAQAATDGPVFETNIRFEDRDNRFFKNKQLLRLRKDIQTTLTFKSKPDDPDMDYKQYRELEVRVSDFSTMKKILNALGFYPEQIYEKYRETFSHQEVHFCLDRMPFGDFLEIEGEKEKIRPMAEHLGLDWHDRILDNYLHIFEVLKERMKLDFNDVTFENFKDREIRFEKFSKNFTQKA